MKCVLSALIKTKSIRFLIVFLFTTEMFFFAIVTGYLAYTSGLHTVKENARQMSFVVNDEITKMLHHYLEQPFQLEQLHRNVILNNQINFANQTQRDKHFVETLKVFPNVTNTYISLVNGSEYGARREDDGSFLVWNSNIEKKTLDYYKYDTQAGRQGYIKSLFSYDTQQRSSYLIGVELKRPGWTDVYASATGRGLVITAVYPVYTPDNELLGVLGSSVLLNWIDEFLKSLTVTEHSSIYIIGKKEELIASSDKSLDKPITVAKKITLISEYENPLLSQSVNALKEKVPTIDAINKDVAIRFDFKGEKFLLHAHPIHGNNNLEWISLILIPEKDLTYPMHDFTNQLVLITLAACILGLITGSVSARYIIKPIIKVNQMAKKIAEGNFSTKIELNRYDEIGQLIHTINDMSTKLKQYIHKLRKDRLQIKLLTAGLETSSNLVIILDANLSVWWVNTSFEVLSGFTQEEIIGKNIKLLLSEQNDPETINQAKECLLNQRNWKGKLIACHKEGQKYVDVVTVTPILDDTGETSYFLVVGQDITEKVKAREAILAARDAQAKAEKIFSIGTMAAGISHEINQPLNSIKVISGGILYLHKQGEQLDTEEFVESIKEISSQADRITNIIKHLRSFIRRDENRLVPCNMNNAVENSLALIGKQLAGHGITVQKQFQVNLPPVLATPTGLEEIVVNLLINAMQALDTLDKKNKQITIQTHFSTTVILEISDNGPGINPILGKTIFDSFTSTKIHGENLGLGLAIVNTIITSYLGTVDVTSNALSGATFTISLPVAENSNIRRIE